MANKKVVVDPITRIEGHLRMSLSTQCLPAQCGAASKLFLKDAIRAMHGLLWNVSAVSVPAFTPFLRFVRLKTLSESRFLRTQTSSAT